VRAEFKVPYAFTSIFLVRSTAYYAAPSDDPIFPAVPGDGVQSKFGQVCWNNLQRHTILACTNSMVIRHPRTGALWYPYFSRDSELERPEWNEPSIIGSVTMLNLSFVIPDKYMGYYSSKSSQFAIHTKRDILFSPITSEHWKTEVQRLFKIRLARLQMDVVGAAQGLGYDFPGAVDELAKHGQSESCRHIKIQKEGWKNISLVGLVGFLLLDFVIWLFTIEVGNSIAIVWFTKSCLTPIVVKLCQFLNKILFRNLVYYTRGVVGIVRGVYISPGRLIPWRSRQ
jgi:hypothetical protein